MKNILYHVSSPQEIQNLNVTSINGNLEVGRKKNFSKGKKITHIKYPSSISVLADMYGWLRLKISYIGEIYKEKNVYVPMVGY